ncbi:probable E3 ubiquitin-protein ligase ZFP1 isoform X2 [Argentina anserina]|uniref:probable E3 ubiquitin-protein ligase ZFP1 isoform X2 n=1 Tax=Argentina anserina TaxID=57926 RepID=UPI00217685AD|nr:probable E3 ubiquitin-protein ligase ZFP1 isoform X2 [Potentilla anserina]
MGHRHPFSTSQVFESENDPNWNHMNTEHPFGHLARAGAGENTSLFYPVESMFSDGMQLPSNWNPPMRSYGYSSLSHSVDMPPQYQPDASGPSHLFQHAPSAGAFGMASGNYAHHSSSSSYDRRAFNGVEGGFVDLTMSSGRGLHKRKSPGIPSVAERGSSSRYYCAGSSSDVSRSTELQQEKVNMETPHMPWDHMTMIQQNYRGNDSSRGEESMRNVRSRSEHDLESNLARTHLSNNPIHSSYAANFPIDHPSTIDIPVQSSNVLAHEWNHINMSPPHGRILPSGGFSHDPNRFLVGSGMVNGSSEAGAYHHDFIPTQGAAVPPSYPGALPQTVRGVRSNYSQRSGPTFRASSSSMRFGPVIHSDEGLQLASENYPRHARPVAAVGWRNSDRNGRSRMSHDRYRVSEETSLHDRFSSEGFMIADRSGFYGSRNMLDHHRDLRLDVDNMSYEELLALGERIGHVNTGVSEDLIPKCLTETIYCSSDLNQEEATCVICLEEYEDRDDVAALKTCGHDYHVTCIKKWLSMKNSCPICKGSALVDNTKGK